MNELERKRAYETLGLQEDASKEEVEKRYDLLLRQDRARKIRNDKEDGIQDHPDFGEINRAYRLILQYEVQKTVTSINQEKYGKYKKYAGQAEKLDHFFSYYRWHLIGTIAVVAMIIYSIMTYVDYREEQARLAALPPLDLKATFIGQFYAQSGSSNGIETVEQAIAGQMPNWKRVEADLLTLNMSPGSQTDIAMQQKAIVQLASERPDVYIMDADTFKWIAQNGVLINLDAEAEGRFADLLPEGAAVKAPIRSDELSLDEDEPPADLPEHVYGIDISSSPLAEQLPLAMKEMIVGIRADTERPDKALQLIEHYLLAAQAE